tara:strand:- start:455 stop:691 length:237 start_codon:yes stop_codon:yes gene_type:complete
MKEKEHNWVVVYMTDRNRWYTLDFNGTTGFYSEERAQKAADLLADLYSVEVVHVIQLSLTNKAYEMGADKKAKLEKAQ